MFGLGRIAGLVLIVSTFLSCKEEGKTESQISDNFDRRAMLVHWADNIIVPAYQDYYSKVYDFQQKAKTFQLNQTAQNLQYTREAFARAYRSWQWVSMFAIGPAESENLGNHSNIYPCDTAEINHNIIQGFISFELPSFYDAQGWPAIDYLLFGEDPQLALQRLMNEGDRLSYLIALSNHLELQAKTVLQEWENGYRDTFVSQEGSGAESSVNKLINDYVYHFEKELRAGKIGIPAGVFSGTVLPSRLEARYSDTLSKSLFQESLKAHKAFFQGAAFKEGDPSGPSLKAYLNELQVMNGSVLLSERIEAQFDLIEQQANTLNSSFYNALSQDQAPFLALYDALQQNVVWLKVDMMQALNVRVDYVDADGD